METTLCFDQTAPFVRYAQILELKKDTPLWHSKAYDYRFFYVYKGEGIVQVDGTNHKLTKGDLLIWQPGISYYLNYEAAVDMTLIGFNFDYTHHHADKNYPIPPEKAASFDPQYIVETILFTDMEVLNHPLCLQNMNIIEPELLEIKQEYTNRKKFYIQKMNGLFLYVLGTVARKLSLSNENLNESSPKIDAIIQYIHQNYKQNLSNQDIGLHFNFHPNYINKLMVMHTGSSLHQYLLRHRISRAIDLMQTTNISVAQIAYYVGFKDTNHFSKYFKQKTGRNPSEYWKQVDALDISDHNKV